MHYGNTRISLNKGTRLWNYQLYALPIYWSLLKSPEFVVKCVPIFSQICFPNVFTYIFSDAILIQYIIVIDKNGILC